MKIKWYFTLIFPLLFLASCQTEEYEVITEQDQNSITINTEAYDLVYRAAMYDGSSDDEIDNSPCFSIEFPYTVNYNGEEVKITSEDVLSSFLASLPAGAQEIIPDFPITVINAGHQRISVMNRQQYAGLQQACRNRINEHGRPITCAQFLFPLQVTSYDRNSQQTGFAIVTSKEKLYLYFDNLTASSVVRFQFPLDIIRNSRVNSVSSKIELENLLKDCAE